MKFLNSILCIPEALEPSRKLLKDCRLSFTTTIPPEEVRGQDDVQLPRFTGCADTVGRKDEGPSGAVTRVGFKSTYWGRS